MRYLRTQILILIIIAISLILNTKIALAQTGWLDVGISQGKLGNSVKERFGFPHNSNRSIYGVFIDFSAGINYYNLSILPRFLIDSNKAGDPEEKYITFKRAIMMFALNTSYRFMKIHTHRFYTEVNLYYLKADFDSLQGDKPSYSDDMTGITIGGRAVFTLRNKYRPEVKMKAFDQVFIDISYKQGLRSDPFKEFSCSLALLLFPGDDISNQKLLFEIGYRRMGNKRLYNAQYLVIGARVLMSRFN